MRELWENTPLTATQVAKKLEVTPNTVIGYADRRGWVSFNKGCIRREAKQNMQQRLDALHVRMDSFL